MLCMYLNFRILFKFLFTTGLLPSPDGAQLGTLHLIQKDILSIFLNVTDSSMIHGYFKF